MAAAFAGKWEHIKNENVEEYFRAIGITDEMMAQIGKLATLLEIVVDGDKVTTKGKTDTTFEIGKEFDDVMITGDILKVSYIIIYQVFISYPFAGNIPILTVRAS